MARCRNLLQLCLTAAFFVNGIAGLAVDTHAKGINWGECEFQTPTSHVCANLTVPLDYSNPNSTKTIKLALIKVPAKVEEPLGSIITNCGGPGYGCREILSGTADSYLNITGGQHDIVSFDPRGTGATVPFACSDEPLHLKWPIPQADAFDVALGQTWANTGRIANLCYQTRQDLGEFVGTAYVARDMMRVVDALDEDGMLRYWGSSYGTVLGATVAAMFPDRIDRLLLDAVVNSHQYYHQHGIDADQFMDADAGLKAALAECIKAGDLCDLSKSGSSVFELEAVLKRTLEDYRMNPIALNTSILDFSSISSFISTFTKFPDAIPASLNVLEKVIRKEDLLDAVKFIESASGGVEGGFSLDALPAIKCSDSTARADNVSAVEPAIEYMALTSVWSGHSSNYMATMCAQWKFNAKERYDGDFNVKTKHPALFIGNTYDSACSMASAHNMSSTFEGSVVVEQLGYGHGLNKQPSACTWKIVSDYFVNGTLPENDTKCKVDVPLLFQ